MQLKHAFIVDDDIDVYSSEEMEWAMAARFRADRDLVQASGLPGFSAIPMPTAIAPSPSSASISPGRSVDPTRSRTAAPSRAGSVTRHRLPDRPAGARGRARDISRRSWTCSADKDGREVSAPRSIECANGLLSRLDTGDGREVGGKAAPQSTRLQPKGEGRVKSRSIRRLSKFKSRGS